MNKIEKYSIRDVNVIDERFNIPKETVGNFTAELKGKDLYLLQFITKQSHLQFYPTGDQERQCSKIERNFLEQKTSHSLNALLYGTVNKLLISK